MEEYPKVIPHNDPEIREANDKVSSISKSYLHSIVAKNTYHALSENIEWIIDHTNISNSTIINDERRCVGFF
jgi:hypothetical protein